MKYLLICIAVFILSGCTMKSTSLEICPEVDKDGFAIIWIDTSGASLVTTTDQTADGKPTLDLSLQ